MVSILVEMKAVLSPDATTEPAEEADEHQRARSRVFELVRAVQLDGTLSPGVIAEIREEATQRNWPDVAKLGLYLGVIYERYVERRVTGEWIERLLERAESEGDAVMAALSLAMRSQDIDLGGSRASVEADRDLARAVALLESWSGPSREAVTAHIECARSCELRDLWELQLAHYAAAEACIDWAQGGEEKLPVLFFNRAEVEVNWVAALRERGSSEDLALHAERARAALDAADTPLMPDRWRTDLLYLRELLDVIAPPTGTPAYPALEAAGEYEGYVHLMRAFATAPAAVAREHVNRALETLDQREAQRVYLLALALAVELESIAAGGPTLGLRWGRELVGQRWERRLAALASMQSLIEVERKTAEHALLQQHALLDDLTGLANRRGLGRFTDGLQSQGVQSVAVALVDLDHFKSVNDSYGHGVGDQTLARLAQILKTSVRAQDLAVRLGGDEFMLLFTCRDAESARRRCETIVAAIAAAPWEEIAENLHVTGSLGFAFGSLNELVELSGHADAALYRAKQAGGGRVGL
jgi:diguanylate cyclase (GGDEF)-like protein